MTKCLGALALAATLLASPARAADATKYIPADADVAFGVNIQQLLNSPIVKKHFLDKLKKGLEANKDATQLLELLGLDPFKDIDTMISAMNPTERDQYTVIFTGKFNVKKIETALRGDNLTKTERVSGKLFLERTENDRTVYGVFVDEETLVAGSKKDAIKAVAEGKGANKLKKDLSAAISAADTKQSLWMAGILSEDAKKAIGNRAQQGAGATFMKAKKISGGINMTKEVAFSLQMEMEDAKSAKEVSEFIDQAKGFLAFFAQDNEMAAPFIEAIQKTLQVKTAAANVNISFKFNEDVVEKAIKLIPEN